MLLASAAVVFAAGTASAADLTGALYLPGQGKVTSDTQLGYERTEYKKANKDDAWNLSEKVTYGVTDNTSVVVGVSNNFDTEGEYNNDHNFDYQIGVSHNMRSGNVLGQVSGGYYTYDPDSYAGHHTGERWQKYLAGQGVVGYDLGNGVTPYASYTFMGQVDAADRDFYQSLFAGVHKYAGNWAVDGGVCYDFSTDGKNKNATYLQAEADYYPIENLALGVYGDYYLAGHFYDEFDGDTAIEVDNDYTVGLRAKVEF